MLVWFNENGILKEQLDSYGNVPRVGSQFFKIFAYFDGIDLSAYGAAYIRLTRPDLGDSEYPVLFMSKADLTYDPTVLSPLSPSRLFSIAGGPNNDGVYPCFLFDFSKIINTDLSPSSTQIVTLLDTPGLWQATITLISTSASVANVVGTITFNVGGTADIEEETELTFSVIAQNIATVIAQKIDAKDMNYIRSCPGFEFKADNGTLLDAFYKTGAYVFDELVFKLFKITSTTETTDNYVSATYQLVADLNPRHRIVAVSNIADVTLSDYATGQIFYCETNHQYYSKTGSSTYEVYDNGILGSVRTMLRFYNPGAVLAPTLQQLYDFAGYRSFLYFGNNLLNPSIQEDYLVQFAKELLGTNVESIRILRLTDLNTWYAKISDLTGGMSSYIGEVLTNDYYDPIATEKYVDTLILDYYTKEELDEDFAKKADVPQFQTTLAVIATPTTNINGWVLSSFVAVDTTIGGFPCYKITENGDNVTKARASDYMKAMTGSVHVPEYDFNQPHNTFFMLPDGTILKPQFDATNGLLLYKMKRLADTDYVNNNILILSSGGGTLTDEQYAYCLTKNARVFYSTTGVFYEKAEEDSTRVLFKALKIGISNNSGDVTITNTPALAVTKATKGYAFGSGASEHFYNKSKLDADFATKNYVDTAIEDVKQNSLQNVDTDEYPTLQDFLDSEGEEGYIYLYPIDLTDLTKGYYRYIWEYIPADDAYEWEYLGTTEIDLSDFEVTFEQETFDDGVVSVEFRNNTDYQLISLIDTVSVALTIPSGISQGWIGSCTFTVGNSVPSFTLVNNSSFSVVFIVNNRKADVSAIALNLDVNGIVECLAECNGFDIRVYMKEVTN